MKRLDSAKGGNWSALDAYLQDVYSHPSMTSEEATEAGKRAHGGDLSARESLVLAHLRLVVRIARRYAGFGLSLADLVAEGNLGLIRAAELYDPAFGTSFHTYASVWIRQRLHRAITSQARAVRIPVWRSQRLRKLARLNDDLSNEFGHPPTELEMAERLGMSEAQIAELNADRIEVVSLSGGASEHEETRAWIEQIPDETTPAPHARLDHSELMLEAIACLHDLDERELEIVALKHGLHPSGEMSFRQVAPSMGISHEWVRRIAQLGLTKARRAMERVRTSPPPLRKAQALEVWRRIRGFAARPVDETPRGKARQFAAAIEGAMPGCLFALPLLAV